jgi:mannosyltransferase
MKRDRFADLAAISGLVALLAFLWGRGRETWFWIDEGIAVGIASQPLADIPGSLRLDGAPPLYYLVLNLWISLFGSSEAATHTLSLLFALAVVPAALWAGWSLFGRRTGWICAGLAAINPYLASYANESRMYTLVALLVMIVAATFLHAFVFGNRRYLPVFVVALTLLLYTHNWGIFIVLATGAAVIPCAVIRGEGRRTMVDGALAFGLVALLYLPWVPTLLYQVSHNPNPWARRPTLVALREHVALAFGGREVVIGLGIGSLIALLDILRRPVSRMAVAVGTMLAMSVLVLAGGWLSAVWAYRYVGVVVSPLMLLLALGLARGGKLAMAALTLAALFTVPVGVRVNPYQKSNAREVAESAAPQLGPGDLVISPDFTQIPLLAYYLPADLRYAGAHGVVGRTDMADWRNSLDRMRGSRPSESLPTLIDDLPVGANVLLACPRVEEGPELVEFHQLVSEHCSEIEAMVLEDERLTLDMAIESRDAVELTPFDAWLLTKTQA